MGNFLHKSKELGFLTNLIPTFSDVEKPFLFSGLAFKAPKSENKKGLSTPQKPRIMTNPDNKMHIL